MRELSAVIIAKDEERDLPACLESVKGLASEIVLVDAFSRDLTAALARNAGARVVQRAFDGYASHKQFALEQATKDWVLSIDADERVTPELAADIRRVLADGAAADAYDVPFEVWFLGQPLRWGGPGSESHIRLFKRGAARFVGGELHEGVEVKGRVGRVQGRMRHIPYHDLAEYWEKFERYTTLAAKKRLESGRRAHFGNIWLLPLWELFVRVFLRLAFLDGKPGLMYAGLSAFHTRVKYVKLSRMQDGASS